MYYHDISREITNAEVEEKKNTGNLYLFKILK